MKLVLVQALVLFARVVEILIFVRVIMSWFRPRSYSRDTQWFFRLEDMVGRLTEPLLAPVRRLLPMGGMGIDFSPFILMLLIDMALRLLVPLLLRF